MSQKYVHINCSDPLQKRSDLQRNSDCLFFSKMAQMIFSIKNVLKLAVFFELLNDVLFLNSIFERRKLI